MRFGLGLGLSFLGAGAPAWTPANAAETFYFHNPATLGTAENAAIASLPNLTDGRGLLASMTGTNLIKRNIRGVPAMRFNNSPASQLEGTLSAAQAQPIVVYVVVTTEIAFATTILLGGGAGSTGTESRITLTTTAYPRTATGGAGTALSAGATAGFVNEPVLVEYEYAGGTLSKIYVNGVLKNTGNGGTTAFWGFTWGNARAGGAPFNGLMGAGVAQLNPSAGTRTLTRQWFYDTYKFGPAQKQWKVMRVGDSTVSGVGGTTNAGGMGQELATWAQAQQSGAYLNFGGSQGGTTCLTLFSNGHHYGIGGTDTYSLGPLLAAQLAAYQPDIIDLVVGINDASATNTPYVGATSQANYSAILAQCRTSLPNSYVLAGPITQTQTGTNVADLNGRWATAIAAEKALGGKIIDRDDFTALNGGAWSASFWTDDKHPNPTGYSQLAVEHKRALGAAIVALG